MNLSEFAQRFHSEEACRQAFKEMRDRVGVFCRNCGSTDHYWLSPKQQYQCKSCKTRTTLKSGTLLQNTKMPFRCWFIAIQMMTQAKKPISALEVQRQVGHKYLEPVWYLMQKIRTAMGVADDDMLSGEIEVDDAFVSICDHGKKEGDPKKPGRGSDRKAVIMVMAETEKTSDPKYKSKQGKKLRRAKMKLILNGQSKSDFSPVVGQNIKRDSQVTTDGFKGYDLEGIISEHFQLQVDSSYAHKALPWVHTLISNLKRNLLGIYHSISKKYLQKYLDEFCYKLNRRWMFGSETSIFEDFLTLSVQRSYDGRW